MLFVEKKTGRNIGMVLSDMECAVEFFHVIGRLNKRKAGEIKRKLKQARVYISGMNGNYVWN